MGGGSNDGTVFELAHGSGTITTLASFNSTNGAIPHAGLIMDSSGNLYGTAYREAPPATARCSNWPTGSGTITTLASFNGTNGATRWRPDHGQQRQPVRHNVCRRHQRYGTVFELAHGSGTITTLASFNGTNGAKPQGRADHGQQRQSVRHNSAGGAVGYGTVFELAKGSGTITHAGLVQRHQRWHPDAGLIIDSSGNLYGTTYEGGAATWAPFFDE